MKFFDRFRKKKKQDPGVEALMRLQEHKEAIAQCTHRFTNLIDQEKSVLLNSNNEPINNSEFTNNLIKTAECVFESLNSQKPSPTFGEDLSQFEQQLQVILRYYQNQMDNNQPIARSFLVSLYGQKLMIPANKKSQMVNPEDKLITKYELNNNANAIMIEEAGTLSEFIKHALSYRDESGSSHIITH